MLKKSVDLMRKRKNDCIYTPKPVAIKMIDMCDLKDGDIVLDPCKGGGVFFDNLPNNIKKDWCEIEQNKDFCEYNKHVDVIIGNPPYSIWNKWIEHTCNICDKFCYIMGFLNFTPPRIDYIINQGFGLTKIHLLKVDYWFGQSIICVFEKNKESIITVYKDRETCDICNSRCMRGLNGNSMNVCTPKIKKC
eukprot:Lithocolla_globosa_v1_NODE_752_length_3331_cov_1184.225275.p2 type:complete len:191 gc:universal NODE_752_length_3331_cov_1184.225275:651-79(-)